MGKHTPKNQPLRRRDATKRSRQRSAAQLSLGLASRHGATLLADPLVKQLHSIAMLTEQVQEAANGVWAIKDIIAKLADKLVSRTMRHRPSFPQSLAGRSAR